MKYDLHLIRGSGGTSGGKIVIVVREVALLARTVLAFTTQARHGGHTDEVVAHGARHGEEVRRVGTRTTAGAARGAVGRHLTCAQGHQGSRVDTMGRSEGTSREPVVLELP